MPKFRITTFDGGGIRGVLSSKILERIWEIVPEVITETHVFSGTSTGAFIALALAYGFSPKEIREFYEEFGEVIFSPKNYPPLFEPEYSNRNLKRALSYIFPRNLRLKDLKAYVIIPSFKVTPTKDGSWGPVFFNNFPDSLTREERVIDVALATSAAPVYFPSHNDYIDGGVVANNPSTVALAMVIDECMGCQNLKDIVLLSIGTGFNPISINRSTKNWGLFEWLLSINPTLPLISLLFDSSVEADEYYTSKILKENYYRINPKLEKPISLDDYKEIKYLVDMAEKYQLDDIINWINTIYL